MLEAVLCVIALVLAGWAIAKNYDAKVVLFLTGIVLLYLAVLLGHPVLAAKASSGLSWVDPFKVVRDLFVKQYSNAGLIILTLFGFAAVFFFSGAHVLPTAKNNRRAVERAWDEAQAAMANVLPEDFPLPARYAHPIVLDRMIRILREGRRR